MPMSVQQALQHDEMRCYRAICLTDLKKDDGQTIRAIPTSLMPANMQGALRPGTTTNELTYTDRSGKTVTMSATTSNYIEATWIGKDNQTHPPLVRVGEQIILYQQGTSDKYFWDTVGRSPQLREVDRLRFAVSATPYTQQQKSDKNSYIFSVDPATGEIRIQTSKANGEPYAFCILANTKTGYVAITDDKGSKDGPSNSFTMNSATNTIQMTNNDKSSLSITGKDIVVYAPRDLRIHAGRQAIYDSPTMTFNGQGGGDCVINVHATAMGVMAKQMAFAGNTLGIQAATKIAGNVVTGPLRTVSMVTGPLGSVYDMALTNTSEGSFKIPSVSADNDVSGGGDRELVAYPEFMKAMNAIVKGITSAKGDASGVIPAATPARVPKIKGE